MLPSLFLTKISSIVLFLKFFKFCIKMKVFWYTNLSAIVSHPYKSMMCLKILNTMGCNVTISKKYNHGFKYAGQVYQKQKHDINILLLDNAPDFSCTMIMLCLQLAIITIFPVHPFPSYWIK